MGASVIAVDISSRPDGAATNNPIEMLLQTFTIMGQTIKTYETDKYADVVIRPNLNAMGGSDFNQRNAAILAGEEAVARIMPELQRKLAAARRGCRVTHRDVQAGARRRPPTARRFSARRLHRPKQNPAAFR